MPPKSGFLLNLSVTTPKGVYGTLQKISQNPWKGSIEPDMVPEEGSIEP